VSEDTAAPAFDAAFRARFETLLAWRRDVRRFRRDPLPEGAIGRLLGTAALAPSVGHAQPWRFVHVASPDRRLALVTHVDAASGRAAQAYDPARAAAYRALKLHGLREAPAILAVFCDETPAAGHGLGIATMPETLRYSVVMAIHTLWLAARAEGIGLGWVSILDPGPVAALLDVPADWSLIAVLCLGYPECETTEPELLTSGWQDRRPVVLVER